MMFRRPRAPGDSRPDTATVLSAPVPKMSQERSPVPKCNARPTGGAPLPANDSVTILGPSEKEAVFAPATQRGQ